MSKPNSSFQFPDVMSLRMAALYIDVSEQRLRILIREGKINATIGEDKAYMVAKADLDAFVATKSAPRGPRKAGTPREGKAWIINVKAADYAAVVAALEPFGITLQPRYNYEAQKAYQAKRKAALAAARASKSQGEQ